MIETTHVLIVEDERIVALDLKTRLQTLGYVVDATLARGEQAVEYVSIKPPNIILMDIHLEGTMDGIEAAKCIFEQHKLPVVFLTAYAEDETLLRACHSMPFGYLVKPCDTREIHATLQIALTRRKSELAVEHSEERLRLAIDAASLGIWEWNSRNDRFITGGHIDTILGGDSKTIGESFQKFIARLHHEDRDTAKNAFTNAVQQDLPLFETFRYQRPDGTTGWIEVYAKAYHGAAGDDSRLIGVIKDISERRILEQGLQQARVVFDTTAEGIYIMDANHEIISVNPAFTHLTGYTLEDLSHQNTIAVLYARRFNKHYYLHMLGQDSDHWQGETYRQRKNTSIFPAWESISLVRNHEQQISHYIVSFSDITTIRLAEEQLNHLAHHDQLTGLPNRVLFNDRLDQSLAQNSRQHTRCAVLFIDLDDFKTINDTLGHTSGDSLLQIVAERLKLLMPEGDTAARLGGDEFIVVMNTIYQPEDAARLARSILDQFRMPIEIGIEQVAVSCSIGISVYPDDGIDRHWLLKAADTAMYSAKATGRNRYAFYTQTMALHAAERMSIEQGLKRALEQSRLKIYYQPIISLKTGAIVAMEALLRWPDEQRGYISPERFIPIAEDSGTIEALGRWILYNACAQWAAQLRTTTPAVRLCVNISAKQLVRDQLESVIKDTLCKTRFPAHLLELEITESAILVLKDGADILRKLKTLGVSLAIDDFGVGFSSLNVLKHLPVDRLKIDKSFIHDLLKDPKDLAIVETICTLSGALGLKVTAEGVETQAKSDLLRQLGCNEAQGFLISEAIPFGKMQALLNTSKVVPIL
ncbi:MAG: EAL domain-containing protein [Gammaproteobacteria bacterium]|nr:EAL domain-containing protein [Gammaproteobacteria bacterium]